MATPQQTVSADEKVEMSLDDLIKLDRKQQLVEKKKKKKPTVPPAAAKAQQQQLQGKDSARASKQSGARKPLKQVQAGQMRKPGQAAKKSAVQAQSKRNTAFNQSRGIQVTPMTGITSAATGKKKAKKKKAGANMTSAGNGGAPKSGASQGGKAMAAGFIFGGSGGAAGDKALSREGFKLPKGTTLKISISNTPKPAAAASVPSLRVPLKAKGGNRGGGQRVSLKAAQRERQMGAGALTRRMGRISVTQNNRQGLFAQSRGLTFPEQVPVAQAGAGGTGGKKKKTKTAGGVFVGGKSRQVMVRRKA